MRTMQRKANILFFQILGLGVFFISLFIFLSFTLAGKLNIILLKLSTSLETICGCPDHFSFLNHPLLFTSLILAGIGLFTFLAYALFGVISLKYTTNKFISANTKNQKKINSKKLNRVAASLGLSGRITGTQVRTPLIFCYGLIRPKILVSRVFIERLTDKELSAVLLHEQHHLIAREPIKQFIIKSVAKILFFVPGLSLMAKKYYMYAELAADEWTISQANSKIPLASAVYKILGWEERMVIKNSAAVPYFSNITEERINKIVNDKYVVDFKILTPKLLSGISLLILVIVSFSVFIYSGNLVIASHENSVCAPGEPTDRPTINSVSCQSQCAENCLHRTIENKACGMHYQSENMSCG